MQEGAVAFVDILGFRGIWEAEKPKVVLEKLKVVEKISEVLTTRGAKLLEQVGEPVGLPKIKVRVFALSDSVIIAAWHQFNPKTDDPALLRNARIRCVSYAAWGASFVMRLGVIKPPYWSYRGAIEAGDFLVDETRPFMIGPAVDDAVALERTVDAAMIRLGPKAFNWCRELIRRKPRPEGLVWADVRLKEGELRDIWVVQPL